MITNSRIGAQGRLGNQLFQYAFLFAQARRLGTTAFVNRDRRGYLLGRYYLDHSGTVRQVTRRQYDKLFSAHIVATVDEHSYTYSTDMLHSPDACDYHGYFQTELYFSDFADEVRLLFDLTTTELAEHWRQWIAGCPTDIVSVHVRRGDYVYSPTVFVNLDRTDYYRRADELMAQLLGRPHLLLVFSDDITWCRANPLFPADRQVVYVSGNDQFTDLYLQSMCNHHIIANSSFSWWGAWLSTSADQQVIAPAAWFGPHGFSPYDTVYCQGWHVI
jgi:hypothetical protein